MSAASSQQLVAHIETQTGQKYKWNKGVSEGVSSYLKAYSKWDYTKQAMDNWAELLRERLDTAHGNKDNK